MRTSNRARRRRHLKSVAALAASAIVAACSNPGEGAVADLGREQAARIVSAIAGYRAESKALPATLDALVPRYLARADLALASGSGTVRPYEYQVTGSDSFELTFRYAGPGMNKCTLESRSGSWRCTGYY